MLSRFQGRASVLFRGSARFASSPRYIHSTISQKMLFEGNVKGIETSTEERMSSIFGGRLKGEPPKSTSRVIVGQSTKIAGIDVPMKPPEPDNCCMSGCVNCVWEMYNDDVRYWRKQRRLAVDSIKATDEVWPAAWDPPLNLLPMKNVPESLRAEKIKVDKKQNKNRVRTRDDVRSLFPKRDTPLPSQVIEAKKRNHLASETRNAVGDRNEDQDDDIWDDVPEHIRVFAEFERKKRLQQKQKKIDRQKKIERRAPLRDILRARENEIARQNEERRTSSADTENRL